MVSCLGSLVQSRCGEGGALQTISLACVGSTRSVLATLGLPCSRRVCFPRLHRSASRLLSREPALSCVHFPGPGHSGPLRFRFSGTLQRSRLGWACVLCLPGLSSSGNQELEKRTLFRCSATSPLPVPPQFLGVPGPVCLVSLLGSRSLAATLPGDVNHPESQEVFG